MAPSKKDEKRIEATRKARETRRRNEAEKATERKTPLGPKPTVAEARERDTSARTAGLAVEKSGPGREPATTERTSPEAERQAVQHRSMPTAEDIASTDDANDQRKRADVEAGHLAAGRSQDHRLAPQLDKDELASETHKEQVRTAQEWNAPRRSQQATAVGAVNGEVKLFSAGGYVFLDSGGEAILTHDQAIDLGKKLQVAFQAVS